MGYALVVGETRGGVIEERSLDPVYFSDKIGLPSYLLLPQGEYDPLKGLCDKVLVSSFEEGDFLNPLNLVRTVEGVIGAFGAPSLILFPHSSFGMDAAPFLAGRLSWPLITDIAGFYRDEEGMVFVKPLYSEKVHAHFRLRDARGVVGTVRTGAFEGEGMRKETVFERLEAIEKDPRREFLGYLEEEVGDVDITRAELLVSVGRGVKEKENIPTFEELASLLGGTLSCSRPVADRGWLPKSRQVGTSGKTVKPKVYLAMGISGAFQHIAGMKNSEVIIAVNRDPSAPIFQYAHYGVIEDMHKVAQKMIERLKGQG
ncbi:MAG: electron transfer flavoprotein subunit alpha/FixB family protein [Deltaproteobacteria bacterium]|nr:MAG: electron transfer flavoprotein subunit alpha/FixB family protein [Deltaproteobacteria bacterium]